jgi:hypothetical protein
VHSITLVTGGVIAGLSYELTSRPWDVARKAVEHDKLTNKPVRQTGLSVVIRKLQAEGACAFFRDQAVAHTSSGVRTTRIGVLQTLGRVGPWGFGFLIWEALGPGLP